MANGLRNRKQLSLKEASEPKPTYLELMANLGAARHIGGLKATKELLELCHIDKARYVLDVGCGIGKTPCYIAKKYDCRVVGVDISQRMIDLSRERAEREGLQEKVEFRVADAQDLPLEDNLFDAVICESVTIFVEDKQRAVNEYIRVTKPEGYVGLNEATWMKTPPPTEVLEYTSRTFHSVKLETSDTWVELLETSGLKDIAARTYKIAYLDEVISRVKWLGLRDVASIWYRILCLYIASPAHRRAIRDLAGEAQSTPEGFYEYFRYGIYVGKKNETPSTLRRRNARL